MKLVRLSEKEAEPFMGAGALFVGQAYSSPGSGCRGMEKQSLLVVLSAQRILSLTQSL